MQYKLFNNLLRNLHEKNNFRKYFLLQIDQHRLFLFWDDYALQIEHDVFFTVGTVLPDIALYFRVYKFKTVLPVRLLMVFKFVYFAFL